MQLLAQSFKSTGHQRKTQKNFSTASHDRINPAGITEITLPLILRI